MSTAGDIEAALDLALLTARESKEEAKRALQRAVRAEAEAKSAKKESAALRKRVESLALAVAKLQGK